MIMGAGFVLRSLATWLPYGSLLAMIESRNVRLRDRTNRAQAQDR
jgi:hypothetical protein